MLNKEEIELVKSYQCATREEALTVLQRVLPHVNDAGLASMTTRAIHELQSISDAEYEALTGG